MVMKVGYRIALREDAEKAQAEGAYAGTDMDARDGFIHLSSVDCVQGSLSKYFSACPHDLVLLEVDLTHPWLQGSTDSGEPRLRLEEVASRDNAIFPHVYGGPLPWECVVRTVPVPRDPEAGNTPIMPPDVLPQE